jgi:hypothetical protein
LRFLGFDNIGQIDQLVVPGVQRNDLERVVGEHVGDDAALHRRDDLLAQRRKGRNGHVDRIAARLLVIGNDLLDCDVLFFGEALGPPYRCGCRRGICDERARQRPGSSQGQRTAEHRSPAQIAHARLPSPFAPRMAAHAFWFI